MPPTRRTAAQTISTVADSASSQTRSIVTISCSDCHDATVKLTFDLLDRWRQTVAVSQFRVCILQRSIWRTIMSQSEGSFKCSFFSLFLEETPLLNFATSRGVDRHLRRPGRQKSWRKGKTSGNFPKARPTTRPTRSLWRTRLRRLQRPGPSKDADPELRRSKCLKSCFVRSARPLAAESAHVESQWVFGPSKLEKKDVFRSQFLN